MLECNFVLNLMESIRQVFDLSGMGIIGDNGFINCEDVFVSLATISLPMKSEQASECYESTMRTNIWL